MNSQWLLRNNTNLERRLVITRGLKEYDPAAIILELNGKHQTWFYARVEFSRIWLASPSSLDVAECRDVTLMCDELSHGNFVTMVTHQGILSVYVVVKTSDKTNLRPSFPVYSTSFLFSTLS